MKYLAAMLALAVSSAAFAQTTSVSEAISGTNNTVSVGASNGGITINTDVPANTEAKIRNVPGVSLGGFSGSFSSDYCGGTAQAGVSVPGFGISGGTAKFDNTCRVLRTAEKLGHLASQRATIDKSSAIKLLHAADILMCSAIPEARDALVIAGLYCPQSASTNTAGESSQDQRTRLGLN